MPFANESRIELRRFELEAAFREHTELWEAWKLVESKAQPLSATAGVFLAGVFAYASQKASELLLMERCLLVFLSLLLLASVFQALRSIWVVSAPSPHLGTKGAEEVDWIIEKTLPPDSYGSRFELLIADTARRWLEVCDDLQPKLDRKSKLLVSGLRYLAASGLVAVALIAVTLAR